MQQSARLSTMIFDLQLTTRQPESTKLLESAVRRHHLSHAYLLLGRAFDDKWLLARQLAAFLNCKRVTGADSQEPTGNDLCARRSCLIESPEYPCQNCAWIAADAHPQALFKLAGEKQGQKIPVEKARLLIAELAKTSRYYRMVVIPDADENVFHRPAANALLKSIEQPPSANCIFFLFASSVETVLPTIVSRAQPLRLAKPGKLGLWREDAAASDNDALHATLQAVRARLVGDLRRYWSQASSQSYVRGIFNSIALTGELNGLVQAGAAPKLLVDLIIDSELEALRALPSMTRNDAAYLSAVLLLGENAKEQMEHYIKPMNALEALLYSLTELRGQYTGEIPCKILAH